MDLICWYFGLVIVRYRGGRSLSVLVSDFSVGILVISGGAVYHSLCFRSQGEGCPVAAASALLLAVGFAVSFVFGVGRFLGAFLGRGLRGISPYCCGRSRPGRL